MSKTLLVTMAGSLSALANASLTQTEIFGRFHPVVVHFPIALLIAAAGAAWIWAIFRNSPGWEGAMRWCLWLGTLGGIVSVATGWIRAEEAGYSDQAVFAHRWGAIATASIALVILIVYEVGRLKDCNISRWLTRLGLLIAMGLVGWVGHEGGMLIYGDAYFNFVAEDSPSLEDDAPLDPEFAQNIQPILKEYCFGCHSRPNPRNGLDLTEIRSPESFRRHQELLRVITQAVETGHMPPRSAAQPSTQQREKLIQWLESVPGQLVADDANQPGPVVMSRLNVDQYNNAIRDLTGLDLKPGKYFPREGGGGEGFANVGEAMSFTPELLMRMDDAARKIILPHARITPVHGIQWSQDVLADLAKPHELRYEAIRKRVLWMVQAELEQIEQTNKRLEDDLGMVHGAYFEAVWRYIHRSELRGLDEANFDKVALEYPVPLSAATLESWHWLLIGGEFENPFFAEAGRRLLALPGPGKIDIETLRRKCLEIEQYLVSVTPYDNRPRFDATPHPSERPRGDEQKAFQKKLDEELTYSYQLVLSRLGKDRGKLYLVTATAGDANQGDIVIWENFRLVDEEGKETPLARQVKGFETLEGKKISWGHHRQGRDIGEQAVAVQAPAVLFFETPVSHPKLLVDARVDPELALKASVQTMILNEEPETTDFIPGRWVYGEFRDGPDVNEDLRKVRDAVEAVQDAMKDRFNPLTKLPEYFAQDLEDQVDILKYFRLNERRYEIGRQRYNRPRPERPYYLTTQQRKRNATGEQLAQLEALDRDVVILADMPIQDMKFFLHVQGLTELTEGELPTPEQIARWDPETRRTYDKLLADMRAHEANLEEAARKIILDFATRAFGMPPSRETMEALLSAYRNERKEGISFGFAVKASLQGILAGPRFVWNIQRGRQDQGEIYRLSDYELARKLSLFLWASLPDPELIELAGESRLHENEVLLAQVRRMLDDERSRALGSQFGAHWLGFAYFDQHTAVDPERFPKYDKQLRQDMFEEAVLFFRDLFALDLSAENIYLADYSFLNERLARHYGLESIEGEHFRKIKVPTKQRGGVGGMGAILTVTSTPLRTSPVRRGDWVTGKLMGSPVPEPPPVPSISEDDTNAKGKSVIEQLAEHRANPTCASCHDIIDPPGLSLENFDPIGRWRRKDSAGNPVQSRAEKPDGEVIDGFEGFRSYLEGNRELIFKTLCRKLLGYALGRKVLLSDQPLLDEMMAYLENNDYRVGGLVEIIVTSRQFQYRQDFDPDLLSQEKQEH